MGDIVDRLRLLEEQFLQHDVPPGMIDTVEDARKEIERLRARLETVRHEAQAATKLVPEHQSKNCHLHAEIERLRAALRECRDGVDADDIYHGGQNVHEIVKETLSDD